MQPTPRLRFFVGGQYVHQNGRWVRTIEKIEGDRVFWIDEVGFGSCTKKVFSKKTAGYAPGSPRPPLTASALKAQEREYFRQLALAAATEPPAETAFDWPQLLSGLRKLQNRLALTFVRCAQHLPADKKDQLGECMTALSDLELRVRAQVPSS